MRHKNYIPVVECFQKDFYFVLKQASNKKRNPKKKKKKKGTLPPFIAKSESQEIISIKNLGLLFFPLLLSFFCVSFFVLNVVSKEENSNHIPTRSPRHYYKRSSKVKAEAQNSNDDGCSRGKSTPYNLRNNLRNQK